MENLENSRELTVKRERVCGSLLPGRLSLRQLSEWGPHRETIKPIATCGNKSNKGRDPNADQ